MASHKSAIKESRQSQRSRLRNRNHRSSLRTALKHCRKAIADGDAAAAARLLPKTLSLLDRTAKHGAIHTNAASRSKSRLTRAVNAMTAASGS